MSDLGLVHIVDMGGDSRAFPINGTPITPREVIADFYRIEKDAVEYELEVRTFRYVNRGVLTAAMLDDAMAHGDTITVYSEAVGKGGTDGAA